MTKTILITLFLGLGTILLGHGIPNAETSIDVEASSISWVGKKVTGAHEGMISLKSGALEFDDNGNLSGGSFTIDMNTITCTDLGERGAKKLVGHLNSDDFFGIDKFPEAVLKITKVTKQEDGSYAVSADATIKGQTNSVEFVTTVSATGASAAVVIDRTEYGIRYGSGSFFDNLGDKTIDDDFRLNVNLVFTK